MADSVVAYLLEHQVDIREGRGDEWVMDCINCSDHNKHLYYNSRKHQFLCFKCGWKGSGYRLVKAFNRKYGYTGSVQLDIPVDQPIKPASEELPKISLPVGAYPLTEEGENYQRALAYLQRRGIGEKEIEEYQIHYTHFGKFAGRIIFPIYHNGKLVSYVGRAINPKATPKVLNPSSSEANPPSHYLYNFDRARFYPSVVLTEGTFDCITTGVVDYKYGAVATFGKKLSPEQVKLIFQSSFREIIFAWDLRDAIPDTINYAQEFTGFYPVKVVMLPGDKDPNDLGHEQMAELVRKAVPFNRINLKLKNF